MLHGLRIADGDEPHNMWFGTPEVFYANKLVPSDTADEMRAIRLFGVMDTYLLRLVREATDNLRTWCLNEQRWIFG